MSNLRRYYRRGNTYFVTTVTYKRQPILVENVDLLWRALHKAKDRSPFEIVSWAVLPDHMHLIIDPEENNLSNLMARIELSFARSYRDRIRVSKKRIWQYRFWDHVIRNQDDLNRHIDYIHYNPVKHGLVSSPSDYPNTSFSAFLEHGYYGSDWGSTMPDNLEGDFGE